MRLTLLPDTLAICRLGPADPVPPWAAASPGFYSLTRTSEELSLVCADEAVPPAATAERGWRALQVQGPLDFALTGILAALTGPLAAAGVSIFAVSTFDTDYLLVRQASLPEALAALRAAGHEIPAGL